MASFGRISKFDKTIYLLNQVLHGHGQKRRGNLKSYYNSFLDVILAYDASKNGLGAVLLTTRWK